MRKVATVEKEKGRREDGWLRRARVGGALPSSPERKRFKLVFSHTIKDGRAGKGREEVRRKGLFSASTVARCDRALGAHLNSWRDYFKVACPQSSTKDFFCPGSVGEIENLTQSLHFPRLILPLS